MTRPFPLVTTEGSPFFCGRAYGSARREAIRRAVQFYTQYVLHYVERPAITHILGRCVKAVEARLHNVFSELVGVAMGAGLPLEDVMLVNARSELLANCMFGLSECTSVGVPSCLSDSGRALGAQTWEWLPETESFVQVNHIRPSFGPDVLTFAEAGQLAKIGINSDGLGLCLNFLSLPADELNSPDDRVPVHLLIRAVLSQPDVASALSLLQKTPSAGAVSLILVDAKATHVTSVEVSPKRVTVVEDDVATLAHANDFEHPCRAESLIRATRSRRAAELLAPLSKIGVDMLDRLVLTHHAPDDGRICHHSGGMTHTLAAFVLDPGKACMHVKRGPACCHPFHIYTL